MSGTASSEPIDRGGGRAGIVDRCGMDRRLGIRAALMRPCFGVAVAALAVVLLSGCGEVGSAGRATWGWGWLLVDDPDLSWSARWGLVSMELVTWAWFFVLGAVLASFLNVVAWRWPRGQSISRPRSHCPHCATPLAWYDNVPIVGWLRLRGRCRHCGGAISPRYVLVEAALGALFVALLLVETLSGGRNLPVRAPNHYGGVVWVIWYTRWDLLRLFAYHAALISLLGTVVLVKLQGQRIPIKLAALLLGLGVVPPLVWPDLHPVPFAGPGLYETYDRTYGPVAIPPRRPDWLGSRPVAWGAADVLSGLACGAGLGLAMEMLARRCGRNSARQGATALAVAAVGTYLGWQAALSMAALSAVGRLLLSAVGRLWPRCRQVPDVAIDFVALLVQLAAWRWLAGWAWWPGPTAGAVLSISFAAGICVLTAVAALLSVDQDTGTAAAQRPEPPVPGPPADSSAAPHLA